MVGSPLQYDRDIWSSTDAYALLRILVVSVVLSLANLQPLLAQEKLLPVFHFTRVQGIWINDVRSRAVRDDEGFVWIGTLNGLERYDGYSIRDFRNVPGDEHSLSSNTVTALCTDTKKRLWVGTFDGGLSLYDRATDRFFNLFPQPGDSSSYQAATIAGIMEGRNGDLWLASKHSGVVRANLPDDAGSGNPDTLLSRIRFTAYSLGTPHNSATDLSERADGKILVASDSGLLVLDPLQHAFSRLNIATLPGRMLDHVPVQCLCRDSNGVLWAGTRTAGLFRIDRGQHDIRNYRHRKNDPYSLASDNIQDIGADGRGNLWIATDAGLQFFSAVTGQVIPYIAVGLTIDPGLRGPSSMRTLSVDRTGTLWIGTAEGGVYWLSPKSRIFPLYGLPNANGTSLRPFETIASDSQGNLWCTSAGTLFQIDIASRTVVKTIDVLRGKKPVATDAVTFIDKKGSLWYGTSGLGLFRVDLRSSRIKNYGGEFGLGKSQTVIGIAPASGESLWIAARNDGLKKFDPASGRFSAVPEFSNSEVFSVMRDRVGRLWVGSATSGVAVLDAATGVVERFRYDPSDPRSLNSNNGQTVYEDPAGRYWIGAGNMIHLWNPATKTLTRYPNLGVYKGLYARPLFTDAKGRLWAVFKQAGLSILDPATGHYTTFDGTDGLPLDVRGTLPLRDGRVLFVGTWGLNVFQRDSLEWQPIEPSLVITSLSINGNPVAPPIFTMASSTLSLPYSHNTFDFEFVATDIDGSYQVRYQYRLEPLESEWVNPMDRRSVRYPGLAPGTYLFKVRAVSAYGRWPDQEIALSINIAPPWWRTTWAYAAYGLLCLAFLFGAYRLRLLQIQLKQTVEMEHFQAEHLAEVDRLKSRFFSNISHEFRTPLTLILGPADQLTEMTTEPSSRQKLGLIKDNAKKLFALVNQLLDFSRLESGMMRLQVSSGDIVQFLRRVVMSFESWAERKKITVEFQSETDLIECFFDRDKLEKIVNNLMSNALKFTPDRGTITVDLAPLTPPSPKTGEERRGGEVLRISIRDTGAGIAPDHLSHIFDRFYRVDETHTTEGTGIGLALTKELVDLHHGTITVGSTLGKGSVFTVTFPIEKSAYASNETMESSREIEKREQIDVAGVAEGPMPTSSPAPTEGKPIVLVVEDNADLRKYIREYLQADYAVREAGDGRSGFERATEVVPDIVISDVMMPEMDGMELCRALKQDIRTSHVPVILLTARAGTDSKIKGLELGADDYVTKPFETKELGARVRNLIAQRRQLREKFSKSIRLKPGEIAPTSMDDAFLKRAIGAIESRMSDENFGVEELNNELNMSRAQVHRKLSALTSMSTGEFIWYMRLHRGMDLLGCNAGTVSEIAYSVGFRDPSHFSKRFHDQFGVTPSDVLKNSTDNASPGESARNR